MRRSDPGCAVPGSWSKATPWEPREPRNHQHSTAGSRNHLGTSGNHGNHCAPKGNLGADALRLLLEAWRDRP